MFSYQHIQLQEVKIDRPEFKTYLLLDREFQGCQDGCDQAMVYIRQAFMIHNQKFHEIYMQRAADLLSDMEVLAALIHLMHGEDDRYYDESNDDTPDFELIQPLVQEESFPEEKHHVNNDLTACVLRDIEYERGRRKQYDQISAQIQDQGARATFSFLADRAIQAYETLQNLLTILTTHTEMKDFGLAGSHNEFDLDTSNYFDKPNPTFLNPVDIEKK